jgi:mRNA-degrading endonuclease RelE of RelBE toxin-antitoxin system
MAYNLCGELHPGDAMKFVETSVFTRRVQKHLDDDSYRLLQHTLMLHPEMGNLIQGSGGLRKIRWRSKGKGKSGGVRVIYYWAVSKDTILMLLIYGKNEQANLTPAQIDLLRKIVEEEYP